MTPIVKTILDKYEATSPAVKANLYRILMQGHLGGTGKLLAEEHEGIEADLTLVGGLALMGGAMMRDFCIVATASEVHVDEARKAGWLGFIGLFLGTVLPFIVSYVLTKRPRRS